jgi:TonB family protein
VKLGRLKKSLAVAASLAAVASFDRAHAEPAKTPPSTPSAAQPSQTPPPEGEGEELSGKAGVVPPALVHFEPATYPEAALKAGLEAEVLLKIVVNVDGSVGDVSAVSPVGNGFDEAAVAAAKKFTFTPATVNGVATAVAIQYLYRFEAPAVEVPVPVAQAPKLGNLEGQLLIAGPDVPLGSARVTATGRDGKVHETTSDETGRFVFVDLPPGDYEVAVSASGFEPMSLTEQVAAGQATDIRYRISPESDGVEVVIEGERPPREVTRRTLERREISRIPGTGGDALRSIQSLPGVARPPGLAGLLIVRGSSPQDTNTFVDGALVPLIYHFGGLSSVVPTELVDRIDFYPGNFGSQYGRVMGGVVDVGLASPNTGCTEDYGKLPEDESQRRYNCFHGLAQVDLIDGRLLLQGPIAEDWTFALGGRRSWVDAWLKPVLEQAGAGVTTAPVYYDYQVFLEHKVDKSRFRVQLYGSDDALEILINNPAAQEPGFGGTLSFGTAFYRAQAILEQELTPKWDLYSTLAVGKDIIDFRIGQAFFKLDAGVIELRSELGYKAFDGLKLNGGIDFLTAPVDVLVRAPEPPREGEPADTPFSSRPLLESETHTVGFRPAWYLDAEVQPTDRLLLVPGVRLDFARDTGHADVSPRVTARYKLFGVESNEAGAAGSEARATTLKGGIGYFYQPPQYQETDEVFGKPGLESNRSLHYSVGVEQELTRQIDVSLEGYYKHLDNLVSRGLTSAGEFEFNNAGEGRTYGLETLVKYKADERFFGWIAYTLARSVRRNNPGEPEYLFQFDQTHNLTVLGSYRLGRGWEAGARFRLVSGNMTTPVLSHPDVPSLEDFDVGAWVPQQGEFNSRRLPMFHQLDVRIEKNWQFRAWRLMTYLDVWNAYNNAAVEDDLYNFDYTRLSAQTGLPIIPSLGVRGEF